MYELRRSDVTALATRFPARPSATSDAPAGGLGAFAATPATDFARHAWDESGVL